MKLDESLFEKLNIDEVPEENKNGDCYVQAYHYVQSHPSALLVHGIVTGRGAIEGLEYNHAWAEEDGEVIDNTMNLKCPIKVYYLLGQVKEDLLFKYTYDDLIKNSVKYRTYGPWEDELWQYP